MKIQIYGYGFVGKAHALALEKPNTKVYVYDPALGYDTLVENPDAVIICVSTPARENGKCDINNVYESISSVKDDNVPILIKSTISIEGWRFLELEFPNKKITFSPEFLRANHAFEDFKNQDRVYIGGGDLKFWAKLLNDTLGVVIELAEPEELILAKYFRNSFLATKVAFFNQIYDLCERLNIEYSAVAHYVTEDPRIGESHSYITKERGFGGHCFPKDTSAILATAEHYKKELTILQSVVEYNNKLRGEE